MEDSYEVVYDSDLEWPRTSLSIVRHYSTLDVPVAVRDDDIVTIHGEA